MSLIKVQTFLSNQKEREGERERGREGERERGREGELLLS
jgi:hypothetical protein